MNYALKSTDEFDCWLSGLKDATTLRKLMARIARLENGNFGDHKRISPDLFELRFFFGAGFRIYYTVKDGSIVLLLVGGDKKSQIRDIAKAEKILQELEE